MTIHYSNIKDFPASELERLFLAVGWESGNYPEQLQIAMRNSDQVIRPGSETGWPA